jgi:hypothetical protein
LQFIKIITYKGFSSVETERVFEGESKVHLTLMNGQWEDFTFSNFKNYSAKAIETNNTEWLFLYRRLDYWNSQFYPKNTDELQCLASLFHLSYEAFYEDKIGLQDFYGKIFYDRLPNKNYLIIPRGEIQTELQNNDFFFNNGCLYKCEYDLGAGTQMFLFRPYNTPIVSGARIDAAKINDLNRRLKDEYNGIIKGSF